MEQVWTDIVDSSGGISHIQLEYSTTPPWRIEVMIHGKLLKFHGDDLFDAMCEMRKKFESMNILLLCNGSRIDVYPSRMSRQMGGGRKAYILKLGQQAKLSDLIDIFDKAEALVVSTVDEQKNFYQNWIKSLSERS